MLLRHYSQPGKQLLIDLVGKIGAITRRRNETALAVCSNWSYNPADSASGSATSERR